MDAECARHHFSKIKGCRIIWGWLYYYCSMAIILLVQGTLSNHPRMSFCAKLVWHFGCKEDTRGWLLQHGHYHAGATHLASTSEQVFCVSLTRHLAWQMEVCLTLRELGINLELEKISGNSCSAQISSCWCNTPCQTIKRCVCMKLTKPSTWHGEVCWTLGIKCELDKTSEEGYQNGHHHPDAMHLAPPCVSCDADEEFGLAGGGVSDSRRAGHQF